MAVAPRLLDLGDERIAWERRRAVRAIENERRVPGAGEPLAKSAPRPHTRSAWNRIYAVVRCIPRARVATYGQIAALAGLEGRPRLVGYALHALQEPTSIPWHRVVNSRGAVSPRADPMFVDVQRRLLEAEGVEFGPDGRIPLQRFQWRPRRARPR